MSLASLQLRKFWLESLLVDPPFTPNGEEGAGELGVGLEVGHETALNSKDERAFRTRLRLELSSDASETGTKGRAKQKKAIRLVLVGEFILHPKMPPEKFDAFREANAPAMLYGIARGVIAQATALTERGRFTLPSLNFAFRHEVANEGKSRPTPKKKGSKPSKKR